MVTAAHHGILKHPVEIPWEVNLYFRAVFKIFKSSKCDAGMEPMRKQTQAEVPDQNSICSDKNEGTSGGGATCVQKYTFCERTEV